MRRLVFEHTSPAFVEATVILLAVVTNLVLSYTLREFLPLLSHASVRRWGWRRSLLLLPAALVPYWNSAVGMMLIPGLLFLTARNVRQLWMVKALGPAGYRQLLQQAGRGTSARLVAVSVLGSGAATLLGATVLWLFSKGPTEWSWWFAAGMGTFAGIDSPLALRRTLASMRDADGTQHDAA